MPTSKPRITITLTDHQHEVLSSLAKVQKISMSSIVVDFLESTMPVLERLAVVLESAANAPQSVKDQIRLSAESAEKEYGHLPAELGQQLDFMVRVAGGAAALSGEESQPAAAEDGPPTSNRGVRISPPVAEDNPSPVKKRPKRGAQ
jgi:hypothetical protein